jgi:hypothetical protein
MIQAAKIIRTGLATGLIKTYVKKIFSMMAK